MSCQISNFPVFGLCDYLSRENPGRAVGFLIDLKKRRVIFCKVCLKLSRFVCKVQTADADGQGMIDRRVVT